MRSLRLLEVEGGTELPVSLGPISIPTYTTFSSKSHL